MSLIGGGKQPVSGVSGFDWWIAFQDQFFVFCATFLPRLNQFAAAVMEEAAAETPPPAAAPHSSLWWE